MAIKAVTRCFEIVSGLKVNFHKSFIGSVGVCVVDASIFSKCLNCLQMVLPFRYLGLPIGGNHRLVSFWDSVIEKIKSRLSRWKGKLLSMARRVCLIKAMLSALPLFYLSFFKAPSAVCKQIITL